VDDDGSTLLADPHRVVADRVRHPLGEDENGLEADPCEARCGVVEAAYPLDHEPGGAEGGQQLRLDTVATDDEDPTPIERRVAINHGRWLGLHQRRCDTPARGCGCVLREESADLLAGAAIRLQLSRAILGPRGAICQETSRNLTLCVTGAPGSSGRRAHKGVPPAVPAAGFATQSWGRPPRLQVTEAGRAELTAAAKSSFVALRPEDAPQMAFDQAFGPNGGRPSAGRWDTFALTISGADALLWCTIAWARATPGPHADALPLPSGAHRPADMGRTRWMAAFTQREAPAVRELLRERLMAVGEAELK
jgi:hypothetical protein